MVRGLPGVSLEREQSLPRAHAHATPFAQIGLDVEILGPMNAAELFEVVADAAPADALNVGHANWSSISGRDANAHDAETCRLLSLAAIVASPDEAETWRVRALVRYSAIGWHEGVAMCVMMQALSVLRRANGDYGAGTTLDVIQPSRRAEAILDEMTISMRSSPSDFKVGRRSPSESLVARSYHEKKALLRLVAQDYVAASDELRQARGASLNERGQVKVDAWSAVVSYLSGESDAGILEMQELRSRAEGAGFRDIAEIANRNLTTMRAGRRDLAPFEQL